MICTYRWVSGRKTWPQCISHIITVYPKKYAHGFVVRCFVVVMQSFIMNSHEVFIHIHQGCFAVTWAWWIWENQSMYNHNKAQQSKNRVHISWDILYVFLTLVHRHLLTNNVTISCCSAFEEWCRAECNNIIMICAINGIANRSV